jgi:hypothetical protein|tara:strand:- start:954 stop:1343 length:390 start_codon:yes stop_codon:yes gene_type:complete
MSPTTEISIAFLRRIYAKGSLSIAQARDAFADQWGDLPEGGGDLNYHLQFSLAHYLGELPSYSVPSTPILVADPQTDAQREALDMWDKCSRDWVCIPDDFDWDTWEAVPYRFAPGWRRCYKTIKPCPSC